MTRPTANPPETFTNEEISEEILRLVNLRGPKKSICPSEAARHLGGGDYRDVMPQVKEVAAKLIEEGQLRATQKGKTVDPDTARGPIRLALPEAEED